MILSVNNIDLSFGDVPVLKNISFNIEEHEKAAIVGINGAGKTTLLRIIMGELSADNGISTLSRDTSVGYLSQNDTVNSANTIYEELLSVKSNLVETEKKLRNYEERMQTFSGNESALNELMEEYHKISAAYERDGGYMYKSELVGVLKGLGFADSEFDTSVSLLSGGQKTRVALGRLLLQKPDFIILDEPTNHLDMDSVVWLENYLLNYRGAVLIVSHDRYFLDRIATKIIELDNGEATVFSGNYTDYAAKKEIIRKSELNAYLNQQREIKHQEEVIEKLKSFNREKSIKRAESRQKALDKTEILDKPVIKDSDMRLTLTPRIESGKDVLSITGLSKAYDGKVLFSNANIEIKRGEHVAIIGKNGTGKTTLLKIINSAERGDSGQIKYGTNVEIGYYDQEHNVLNPEKTLFDEISDAYPYLTNTEIRNTLAAFLFTGDDVFKLIGSLSGGEKGRVSLAKLMLSDCNFLILDEPTNHLDITSKEILEDALNSYTGTLLFVSHDRYFINRTASRILDLNSSHFYNYIGNYDYYLEKINDVMGASPKESITSASKAESASKSDWQAMKDEQARLRKRENDIKRCEKEIEGLEAKKSELEARLLSPDISGDYNKLNEITKELDSLSVTLNSLYDKWELLSE